MMGTDGKAQEVVTLSLVSSFFSRTKNLDAICTSQAGHCWMDVGTEPTHGHGDMMVRQPLRGLPLTTRETELRVAWHQGNRSVLCNGTSGF